MSVCVPMWRCRALRSTHVISSLCQNFQQTKNREKKYHIHTVSLDARPPARNNYFRLPSADDDTITRNQNHRAHHSRQFLHIYRFSVNNSNSCNLLSTRAYNLCVVVGFLCRARTLLLSLRTQNTPVVNITSDAVFFFVPPTIVVILAVIWICIAYSMAASERYRPFFIVSTRQLCTHQAASHFIALLSALAKLATLTAFSSLSDMCDKRCKIDQKLNLHRIERTNAVRCQTLARSKGPHEQFQPDFPISVSPLFLSMRNVCAMCVCVESCGTCITPVRCFSFLLPRDVRLHVL